MSWISNYRHEERLRAEPGLHRCVITGAEEGVSSAGNQMITIHLRLSKFGTQVKSWLVEGENFNRDASALFDAFPEIGEGNFKILTWTGCEGAANIKTDKNGYLKVAWFISPEKAKDLPPFEGEKPERQTVTKIEDEDTPFDEDCPF